MKNYLLILIGLLPGLFSCNLDDTDDGDDDGNWLKLSDFEGDTRTGAVSFTIDGFAYVGLGSDGEEYLLDTWRYDPSRNFWQEVASFPGVGRISAVAFTIDGKGYVGTGFNDDQEVEELGDFWRYDPDKDEWTEVAAFAGTARYSAVAFTLGDQGYVGTGFDGSYLKDFWRYDPNDNTWSQSLSMFGSKRESAFAFVLDGKAFVGSGLNNSQFLFDFWAFDPNADTWIDFSIEDDEDDYFSEFIDAMGRFDAVAFVVDDMAYITTGQASSYLSDVISFDPISNVWDSDFTGFEGQPRGGAVGFVIEGNGYIATGRSSLGRHDDIWLWEPFEEYESFD